MYNWSTDIKKLKKYPEKFTIWKLEQIINYGLGRDKLDIKKLKKYFCKLNIDPGKKAYLNFILYGKKPTFS